MIPKTSVRLAVPDPSRSWQVLHAGGYHPRTFQGLGVGRVHLQVVDNALVDHFGLGPAARDD